MNILVIHIGHDSSVALIRDGRIVADVAEERFTRTKHYCGLPIQALDYCVKSQSLAMADNNAEAYAAAQLADGKIVAWFQGRMESGLRALGALDPDERQPTGVQGHHQRSREVSRAVPAVLPVTAVGNPRQVPGKCPRRILHDYVVHLQGRQAEQGAGGGPCRFTLRPQTVKESFNGRFWRLINEFSKLTGECLLLNMSFNLMGEPIVNHPREAVRCFYDNGLDLLVLGNLALEKRH